MTAAQPSAAAVIAAAGSGERLGADLPKALVELAGKPLVAWCLEAVAAAESIEAVVVAAPLGHEAALAELAPEARVVAGGATRAESVAAALEEVDADLVAIHDAARPLARPELFDEVVATLASRPDADGVIAAAPITDTVKRARDPRPENGEPEGGGPRIAKTESRDHLWVAQTPQAFRVAALREALATDPEWVKAATDEAMLIEKAGGTVLISPAQAHNLKITTVGDLRIAAALLAA